MNDEDKYIQGNFYSDHASIIRVQLNRCSGEDYCKSEKEITQFMKNKYLIVYLNKVRFQAD